MTYVFDMQLSKAQIPVETPDWEECYMNPPRIEEVVQAVHALRDGKRKSVPEERLCCTNPVRDSSRESSVVAGMHEQTHTPDLQDQKLASLQ